MCCRIASSSFDERPLCARCRRDCVGFFLSRSATCCSGATSFFFASGFFFSGFFGGGACFSNLSTVFSTDAKSCFGGGLGFDFGRGAGFCTFLGGSGFGFSTAFGLGRGFSFGGLVLGSGTATGSGAFTTFGSGGGGGAARRGGGGGGGGAGFGFGLAVSFGFFGVISETISTSMAGAEAIKGRSEGNTPIQAVTNIAICNKTDMTAAVRIPERYFLPLDCSGSLASSETLRKPAALNSPITAITSP